MRLNLYTELKSYQQQQVPASLTDKFVTQYGMLTLEFASYLLKIPNNAY